MNYPVMTLETIKKTVREVPDFPKPGILFKDITTALKNPEVFNFLVESISEYYNNKGITKIVAIEARGFMLGGAVAHKLNAGFVPIRKPGKLPSDTYSQSYTLEYGENTIEIHQDALFKNDIILLHDDLLATGGTVKAATELLKKFSPKKVYINFMCELNYLNGRKLFPEYDVFSLLRYDD